MLDEAGFDTLESLALPISEFRGEVAGMKAGHARALLNIVAEERTRLSKPCKLNFIKQGTPPVPESTRDNSIEKRALAGKFPKFPSNEEDGQRKVMSWFVGAACFITADFIGLSSSPLLLPSSLAMLICLFILSAAAATPLITTSN